VPDLLLVERAKGGDMRAYDLLVIKHQRRIHRLVANIVGDRDLAFDVVQETFISAWQALGQFRGDAQFYTWLRSIAANMAKRMLQELKRDQVPGKTGQETDDHGEKDGTFPRENDLSTDSTPETELAGREIVQKVQRALARLPEKLRYAVTLREIEGLDYEEIAQAMNCSVNTVRSRIFRAREAIAAEIKPLLSHRTGKRW
jgi:RNA polymerase sigma-70 factor (ECF subfamily)